jgi:hypothetical protein
MGLMWDASFLRLCETPAAAFFGLKSEVNLQTQAKARTLYAGSDG